MTAAALVVFSILIWLLVFVILGFLSGWYLLMRVFPDRPHEEALAIFKGENGMVGPVSMHGTLTLSLCPSGLRVGIMKLFGPFQKDFLVPWTATPCRERECLAGDVRTCTSGLTGDRALAICWRTACGKPFHRVGRKKERLRPSQAGACCNTVFCNGWYLHR
jgi:hypothetical protein